MEIGSHWLKPNDELVFMNGVSADRFCEHYDNLNMHRLYSIGPQTSARLRDYGAENIIESPEPSIDHLFEKIIHTSG
jgi:uroporphyrinogen-III synthase